MLSNFLAKLKLLESWKMIVGQELVKSSIYLNWDNLDSWRSPNSKYNNIRRNRINAALKFIKPHLRAKVIINALICSSSRGQDWSPPRGNKHQLQTRNFCTHVFTLCTTLVESKQTFMPTWPRSSSTRNNKCKVYTQQSWSIEWNWKMSLFLNQFLFSNKFKVSLITNTYNSVGVQRLIK